MVIGKITVFFAEKLGKTRPKQIAPDSYRIKKIKLDAEQLERKINSGKIKDIGTLYAYRLYRDFTG